MTAICALPNCQRELPERAIQEGDKWCSNTCCRIAHGNPTPKAVLANHLEKRGRWERAA